MAGIAALDQNDVDLLDRPTETAVGLPGFVYCDPNFFQTERELLLTPAWLGVAFTKDLSTPGAMLPITIAGWELLLVRSKDGTLSCFFNVCRHRGMKLVQAVHADRVIRCPYHSWTYGLDGTLLATPAIAGVGRSECPAFDRAELGLVAIRCQEWNGIVFVNISGTAPELDEHFEGVSNRIDENCEFSRLQAAREALRFEVAANWKLLVEGTLEEYHIRAVHSIPHDESYRTEDGGLAFSGYSYTRPLEDILNRLAADGKGRQPPVFDAVRGQRDAQTMSLFLFPNVELHITPVALTIVIWLPLQVDKTMMTSRMYLLQETDDDQVFADFRKKTSDYMRKIIEEDRPMWETLQRVANVRQEAGIRPRFSPRWERALHAFQRYVATTIVHGGEQRCAR